MRKMIVVCASFLIVPLMAQAQPVPNGQCCFTHEHFKTGTNPRNGCITETTCSEIEEKGLFVRCYHKKKNHQLRIRDKRPKFKFSTQEVEVTDGFEEFEGYNYPIDHRTRNWTSNSEFVEGPDARLKVRPIRSYCSGRMAKVRQRFHEKDQITYRFKIGTFLRDFTGRIIERYQNGQIIRERESRVWNLILAVGEIVVRR